MTGNKSPDTQTSEKAPNFVAFEPSSDLSLFVHRYMYGSYDADGPVCIAVHPTGGIFLSYVAGDPLRIRIRGREEQTRSRLFIGGQLRNEHPVLSCDDEFRLLGLELRPVAFHRLFHRDADAFTDCMTDFHDVFPTLGQQLEAALSPSDSTEDLITKMEHFLRQLIPHAAQAPIVEGAIDEINRQQGIITADELSEVTGYSARQLQRYFVKTVGVPAKHYAKIVQINSVVSSLMENDSARLQELSAEYGYFDQAHFIHDFQRFIQSNPTDFLRSESDFLRTYLGNVAR